MLDTTINQQNLEMLHNYDYCFFFFFFSLFFARPANTLVPAT